jgi:curved DNA-binding protein CbpA
MNHPNHTNDNNTDPYNVLGVNPSSTAQEIKAAYRKLALRHHPDKQSNEADRIASTELFAHISHAYEILSNESSRRAYDMELRQEKRRQQQQRQQRQNQQHHSMYTNHHSFHDPLQVFEQVFRDDFGMGQPFTRSSFFGAGAGFGNSMFGGDPFMTRSFPPDSFFNGGFNGAGDLFSSMQQQQLQMMQQQQQQQQSHYSQQQSNYSQQPSMFSSYSSSSSSMRMGPNGQHEQVTSTTRTVNGTTTKETIVHKADGTVERHVTTTEPQQQQPRSAQLEQQSSRSR